MEIAISRPNCFQFILISTSARMVIIFTKQLLSNKSTKLSLRWYVFFKFPVLTYNRFPTQREMEKLFFFKTAKVFDYETFYFEVLYRQTIKICFYVYFSKTYNWIPPLKQVQKALLSRRTMRPASNS